MRAFLLSSTHRHMMMRRSTVAVDRFGAGRSNRARFSPVPGLGCRDE
jgi:hypothetical protein